MYKDFKILISPESEEGNLKASKIGISVLTISAFTVGAYRGFSEANGVITDSMLESALENTINLGALPTGTGAVVGTLAPVFTLNKMNLSDEMLGGFTFGLIRGGVAGYSGAAAGYFTGRATGEILKCFS